MGRKDPRVDAYIAKSADFAKPILTHIRAVVHTAVPDVQEDLKWSMPAFMYKGMLCGMGAFKQHAIFGFWKYSLVVGDEKSEMAMGNFGKITKVSDLPPKKALTTYVKKAAALNDAGIKVARKPKGPAKPVRVPPALTAALKKNKKAYAAFDAFPRSHKREYAEWIADAKTDETRGRRLVQAIAWIADGKSRNWKYGKRGC